jgi:ADP-ribose pyrophosphatase
MNRDKPGAKVKAQRVLFDHPVVRIVVDQVEYQGYTQQYIYLDSNINAVATLGITNEGAILLTRQYRHPVRQEIYDLPAGKLEPGEEPLHGAQREFEEETGFKPGEIIPLGVYNQFPGMLHATTHLFFARNLVKTVQKLDEGEILEVIEIPVSKLIDGVLAGEFIDGSLQLAVLLAFQKGLLST